MMKINSLVNPIRVQNGTPVAPTSGHQGSPPGPGAGAPVGLQFTETMRGYFASGSDDFWAGARQGKLKGSSFEFTLTIIAEDLDAMLASPAHEARITGSVVAPTLSSQPLTVREGTFNLFVADPQAPSTRHMIYRMKLTAEDGHEYSFDGFKAVRHGRARHLWHDTTTLYITLRDGPSMKSVGGADMAASAMSANHESQTSRAMSAPPPHGGQPSVIGKGILKISASDFLRQLTTFQVKNAPTLAKRLDAEIRFGRFFAGTLYETYTEGGR